MQSPAGMFLYALNSTTSDVHLELDTPYQRKGQLILNSCIL